MAEGAFPAILRKTERLKMAKTKDEAYCVGVPTEEQLEAIRGSYGHNGHPHTTALGPSEETDSWVAADRPHCWGVVEEARGYTACVDFGYGHLAVLKGTKVLGRSSPNVVVAEVVMLDKEYYGSSSWLWFPAALAERRIR